MATVHDDVTEGLDREQKFSRWLPGLLHVLNTHRSQVGVRVEELRQIDDHGRKVRLAIATREERRRVLEAYEADLADFEARYERDRERFVARVRDAAQAYDRAQDAAETVVSQASRTIAPITDAMVEKRLVPEFLLATLGLDSEDSPLRSATPAPGAAAKPAAPTTPPALRIHRTGLKTFLLLWDDPHRTDDTRYEALVTYRPILSTMNYRGRAREIASEQDTAETIGLHGSKTEYAAGRAALASPISFQLVAIDASGQRRLADPVHLVNE